MALNVSTAINKLHYTVTRDILLNYPSAESAASPICCVISQHIKSLKPSSTLEYLRGQYSHILCCPPILWSSFCPWLASLPRGGAECLGKRAGGTGAGGGRTWNYVLVNILKFSKRFKLLDILTLKKLEIHAKNSHCKTLLSTPPNSYRARNPAVQFI